MKIPTKLLLLILMVSAGTISAQEPDSSKLKASYYEVNPYVDDNEACLKCHGETKYMLYDEESDRSVAEHMCPDRRIDREQFYSAEHKSFSCTDCHSWDYNEFPHSVATRMEPQMVCMDCHGYDETFAKYHFEGIEVEFSESIHNMEEFTCWKCHDPHSYKAFMRNASDIREAVLYDNNMCLKCHSDFDQFMMLTDRPEINVIDSHDWLPNQAAHFRSVRCIECHTQINDTIFIAHKILPKEDAVKNCTECHTKDSRLMHTLYKFESKEQRKAGFVNGIMISNSYVIGANQNVFLNRLSLLAFGFALLLILFHTYLRIRNNKNN